MSFLSVGLPLPILVGVAYAMGVKNFLLAAIPIVLLWKWRRVYVIVKTFPRDVRFLYRMRRLVSNTKSYEKDNKTVVSVFQENVLKNPDRPIYVLGDEVWTYKDVDQYSNKIANIFHKAGFAKKDVVALMMQNSPAYVSIWLGLAKIGVITALINTNLKGPSLKHCVNTASCKAIIFADEFFEVVLESCNDLKLYQSNGNPTSSKVINLEKLMAETSNELLEKKDIMYTDKLLYIYTSGTTGMPKAAILPHSRYILGTMATMCLLNAERSDIIYNPLPLYHTAGGALGVGPALLEGLTTVLRVKFSASAYISDCIKYKCTIGQYIGEMCRYMLATPPKPEDTMHNLKFMIGNGLRPAIWSAFVERFRIPQITEVYGSTEGNVNIANIDNTVGAVGSVPQFLPNSLIPVAIVKIDMETEEPIRDCDGLCKRCDKDETGMFVGLIKNNDPSRQYHGYVNQADSKKKVWRDVFSKGDSVFVSGDLMLMDEFGYIYFKDRTGDTYRWKGENIATSEVEAVISSVAGLRDCSVYGVKIGDLEGKAGMAAVVDPNNQLDLQMFTNGVDNSLPIAARPIFLRVLPSMEMTGTYKMKKVLLQKDGFDPDIIKDKLYFRAFNAAVHILFSSFYFKLFNCTVTNEFEKLVRKHPNKVCFHFEEQIWTFKQVDEYTNKVAQVFHNAGYKKGDTVAIFMTNRPEYACIWLGLGKLGIISALINTNLKLKPLTYSIGIGACKAVIFSNDLCSAIHDIRPSLESTIRLFQLGGVPKEGISSLDNALKVLKPEFSNVNVKINFNDHLLYIYTSGTTGFPKAAIMPHSRFLLFSSFARYLLDLKRDDIVYNPLPMYHTAGGILGVMTAITLGATAVIKRKFSASSYIPDCIKYKCTVGQYIGEICRYILSVPSKPSDKEHRLRIMVGNGLRSSIWAQFVSRFNIPNVMEIYGSTEGNLLIANVDNTIGAVGSLSKAFPMFNKYIGSIIKVDPDTMEPIRNEKGFCIECSVDEPGMFVGIIPWKGSMKEFYGYVDKGESNKKFIYDVFKKGDRAFVSGDLMVQDEMGYIYFKDRTGDTFRWKGENVSTSECESLISSTIGLTDCVVYGVQVHDLEGRAGMLAVLDPDCKLDMDKLARALDLTLPKYQHPIFIRLLSEIEMTGTFKFKKLNLQKEGFDPNIIKDPIFFRKGSTYVRMTRELHDQILNGSISL